MKIGFVIDDSLDRPDGVQQAVLVLGEALKQKGHEVHYLTSHTLRKDIANIHSLAKNVRVKFNGNQLNTPLPASNSKIRQFLKDQAFDVLHIQMPYSPFFAAKVISLAPINTKLIGTFHILPYRQMNVYLTSILGLILRKSLSKLDHVISVSLPAREFCQKVFKVDSVVIPNPVNINQFKASKILNTKEQKIVFLGRLVPRKGVIQLLDAFTEFSIKYPNQKQITKLIIAGKGPLEMEVKRRVVENPMIEYVGYVEEKDKPRLLADADLAVFPSISGESFGIVLIEAMAAGAKLILAGNNPGYLSVIGNKTDLIIDPMNTAEFARRINQLLKNNARNNELSMWLRQEVKQYDATVVADQVLKLYNS